jgi:hypothetical protein
VDSAKPAAFIVYEWHCAACGKVEEERAAMEWDALRGYAAAPPIRLPEGWTLANGEAYCWRHRVRPWVKVTTERGPIEGNRVA